MCLAIPGQVLSVNGDSLLQRQGLVEFDGVRKTICLALVPEANVGDYVIVHAGFAISQLDEHEAIQVLEDFRMLVELDAECGP